MRRAAKIDDNQAEIVDALRKLGVSVWSTAALGKGFPDLVCGYRGKNYLFEVKDGAKPLSARKLTEDEARFFGSWNGQVNVIESIDDALIFLGLSNASHTIK